MQADTINLGKEILRVRRKRIRIEVELGILWVSGKEGIDYIICEGEERSFDEKGLVIEGLIPSNFFRLIPE